MPDHDIVPGPWGIGESLGGKSQINFKHVDELNVSGNPVSVKLENGEDLDIPSTITDINIGDYNKLVVDKDAQVDINGEPTTIEESSKRTGINMVGK